MKKNQFQHHANSNPTSNNPRCSCRFAGLLAGTVSCSSLVVKDHPLLGCHPSATHRRGLGQNDHRSQGQIIGLLEDDLASACRAYCLASFFEQCSFRSAPSGNDFLQCYFSRQHFGNNHCQTLSDKGKVFGK